MTRMYNTGVPEKLIAEKSGHKSLKTLHVYERTSKLQEKSAGQCIQSGASFDPISSIEDKLILCKSQCSLQVQLAPVLVTSLNLAHFGAF